MSVEDPFYRYKIPKLIIKIEGSRTQILNLPEISKSLNRDPIRKLNYSMVIIDWRLNFLVISKYFSYKLCTQVRFDSKKNCYTINGNSNSSANLEELLAKFINTFVVCSECNNPETLLSSKKKAFIEMICNACGRRSLIDPKEKLTKIILKMLNNIY